MKSVTAGTDIESQSINAAYCAGYLDGHRAGHRVGWDKGIRQSKATDVEFVRGIADELRRRELEDESDTSHRHQWVADLLESLEAKSQRDSWDNTVRAGRLERGQAA